MFKTSCFIVVFLVSSILTYGQNEITLEDLRTPTSPAFILIGDEPESVTRPTTPKGLATSLNSSFSADGIVPDVAIEFAPYWLKSHPSLSFEEYYNLDNPDLKERLKRAISQNSSISLATAGIENSQDGRKLGFGFRTQIVSGVPSDSIMYYRRKIQVHLYFVTQQILSNVQSTIEGLIDEGNDTISKDEMKAILANAVSFYQQHPDQISSIVEPEIVLDAIPSAQRLINKKFEELEESNDILEVKSWLDNFETNLETDIGNSESVENLFKKINDLKKGKQGFLLEFAMASLLNFPDGTYNSVSHQRLGIWLTYAGKPVKTAWEFIGLTRYLIDFDARADTITIMPDSIDIQESNINNFDYGLRILLAKKRFSFSLEYIGRAYFSKINDKQIRLEEGKIFNGGHTWRLAINIEYKVSDIIYLTATFGKNFGEPFQSNIETSELLSVIGLNIGLPVKQALNPPQ